MFMNGHNSIRLRVKFVALLLLLCLENAGHEGAYNKSYSTLIARACERGFQGVHRTQARVLEGPGTRGPEESRFPR